jgi:hypothetical protein
MCTLVARWTSDQDPTIDAPHSIFWGDGRGASLQDYIDHQLDTHELVETPGGLEVRMYPWIIGDVRYDAYARTWFVAVPGQDPVSLDLTDHEASDSEIRTALYQLPMVFRSVIHR